MTALSGLVPILATPFHSDGSLDRPSLVRLVEFQLASGAEGVAIFGLASESFALSNEERGLILDTVVSTVKQRAPAVPVVAGIAATGLAPALEQARQAVDAGADLLMVLPPFLVRVAGDQVREFYGSLASTVGVPIMVQDAPGLTGVVMDVSLIAQLAHLPGVDYVKIEAPPTAPKVSAVVQAVDGQLSVFGGQNAQFVLDELERGAIGTMPASELTDLLAEVVRSWRAGDTGAASSRFTRLLPLLVYGLQGGIAWAVHKEILVRRGIITDARVRAPAVPLDPASHAGLRRLLEPFETQPSWHVVSNVGRSGCDD